MRVDSLECVAEALFHRDQPTLFHPLLADVAQSLGEEFQFSEVSPGQTGDGLRAWIAREGIVRRQGQPPIRLRTAHGHTLLLAVHAAAESTSDDARDALTAIWKFLAPSGAPPLDELATVVHRTTAIVAVDKSFDDWLLAGKAVEAQYLSQLRKVSGDSINVGLVVPRFRIEVAGRLGGQALALNLIIEPRVTARIDRRVFFTQSSLPSAQHLAMVRELLSG